MKGGVSGPGKTNTSTKKGGEATFDYFKKLLYDADYTPLKIKGSRKDKEGKIGGTNKGGLRNKKGHEKQVQTGTPEGGMIRAKEKHTSINQTWGSGRKRRGDRGEVGCREERPKKKGGTGIKRMGCNLTTKSSPQKHEAKLKKEELQKGGKPLKETGKEKRDKRGPPSLDKRIGGEMRISTRGHHGRGSREGRVGGGPGHWKR